MTSESDDHWSAEQRATVDAYLAGSSLRGYAGVQQKQVLARAVLEALGPEESAEFALRRLVQASDNRDAVGFALALASAFTFGFARGCLELFLELADQDWHESHEELVGAFVELADPRTVPLLIHWTQWVPDYMAEYDEFRVLATKSIWCLGKIASPEAKAAIFELMDSDEELLREAALQQPGRWL